jgi:hypothetical protein
MTRRRRLALSLCAASLAVAVGTLWADDGRLALRVWLFRLPGTELGLHVTDWDGDGDQDLAIAHLRSPEAGGYDRAISVFLQGAGAARFDPEPVSALRVPKDACAFLAGDFDPAPGAEVIYVAPTRVVLARGDELVTVAELDGFFDYPERNALPAWNLTWDLDGDGLPEVLVPTKEGYALLRRGGPDEPLKVTSRLKVRVRVKFGPTFETQLLGRFVTTTSRLRRVVAADVNRDGRLDLVAYRDKGLARFHQREDGSFPEKPDREEPLEVASAAKAAKDKEGSEAFANVRLTLRDLDGDGGADLLVTKTVGEVGVFETLRTQQLVFRAQEGGGWDESKPDVVINLKGISDDPVLLDWDGDGKLDMILSSYRMDMFTNVKRAITDSMTISYMIFRQGEDGELLAADPSYSVDVDVPLDVLERKGGIRAMKFEADLNGDGVRDAVARRADGGLEVRLGTVDDGDVAFDDERPIRLAVGRTEPPRAVDLDGDGAHELILEPFGDAGAEGRVVRVVGVAR